MQSQVPQQQSHDPGDEALVRQIKLHWSQHQKSMYRDLQRSGQLDAEALDVAQETRRYAQNLHRQAPGIYSEPEAWSQAIREIALSTS